MAGVPSLFEPEQRIPQRQCRGGRRCVWVIPRLTYQGQPCRAGLGPRALLIVLTRSTAKKLINMQGHVDESFELPLSCPPIPQNPCKLPISITDSPTSHGKPCPSCQELLPAANPLFLKPAGNQLPPPVLAPVPYDPNPSLHLACSTPQCSLRTTRPRSAADPGRSHRGRVGSAARSGLISP